MKTHSLVSIFTLVLAQSSIAIIDVNDNGLSDVWERHFNSGGLFSVDFLPHDDPDGDGWSNAMEALAGTNPFEANTSTGCLRLDIIHIPAVYSNPGGEDTPLIVTPETITLSWPTVAGKKYALLYSVDLDVGTWQPLEDPFIGSGNLTQYSIPVTQPDGSTPDKLFWRVSVTDTDSDGNGVTDAEEYLLSVDDDLDNVPDEWERHISHILFADYGIIAPADPAQFNVEADYGGINTSALLVYQNLTGDFDLAKTEIVASPFVEGSMKAVEHYKSGFIDFTQLPHPPQWQETGPVLNFFLAMNSKMNSHFARESLYTDFYFKWDEEFGHREEVETYSWNQSNGWASSTTNGPQSWLTDNWIWELDPSSTTLSNRVWNVNTHNSLSLQTCAAYVSGDPPVFSDGNYQTVSGSWTSTTPTKRIGDGAEHSSGFQASKPNPGVGYQPTYKESITFNFVQELSKPYTTANLLTDAEAALEATTDASSPPVSSRNLVENETRISLVGGKYRLGWTLPNNVPVYPGNSQVNAVFLWQEVTDSESTSSEEPSRMIKWKHQLTNATPGTLSQTPWHDLPPPETDGISWIRTVSPSGSITVPGAILVNKDDDDGDGNEDRNQSDLALSNEDDLIALNFEAVAPGIEEKAMVYRLSATGAGRVRLWQAFPDQPLQRVELPYKLQSYDYTGSTETRPQYYIEAIKPGSLSLDLHAEVLGQKFALTATADFKCLDISIDLAADMKGIIGDIVPSNIAGSKTVHFVTTKGELPNDSVVLTASGINENDITPQHSNQLVEWVVAEPISGNPPTARIPRSSPGKFPVSIRLISTGQSTPITNVWVTWAELSLLEGTLPHIREPEEIKDGELTIGSTFRGAISWRYVCQPIEMFDLTSDIPNFSLTPEVPAPGIHPWTGEPLSPGAAMRYDASRQVRVILTSNDPILEQTLHIDAPDIPDYPTDLIEGNDDPNMSGETVPYLPEGVTGIMRDGDQPFISLHNSFGADNPDATIFQVAQFKQFARVQIGSRWYKCSNDGLSELIFRLKRDNVQWVDDGSSFVLGNVQFPPQ